MVIASACGLKGHGFDSRQGHIPQVQALFGPGRGVFRKQPNDVVDVSLPLSPPLPLSLKSQCKKYPRVSINNDGNEKENLSRGNNTHNKMKGFTYSYIGTETN